MRVGMQDENVGTRASDGRRLESLLFPKNERLESPPKWPPSPPMRDDAALRIEVSLGRSIFERRIDIVLTSAFAACAASVVMRLQRSLMATIQRRASSSTAQIST